MMQFYVKHLLNYYIIFVWIKHLICTTDDDIPVTYVQTIINGNVILPCDLTTYDVNNTVNLITWYKNQQRTPIYSFDLRKSRNDLSAHWHNTDILKNRSFFQITTKPASLVINHVIDDDEGLYQCRIEFIQSRTKVQYVQVIVIVPPGKPTIIDETGKELTSRAGPYEEGSNLKLICIVSSGRPEPNIKWWRSETLLESNEIKSLESNTKSREIIIENLQRIDQHTVLTCQASNNNISQPSSTSVIIELYFRPISVEILSEVQPFSENRKYELNCEVIGSRPPAKISWWLDKQKLFNHSQKDLFTGNVSISTLEFFPTKADNEKSLTCRADNTFVRDGIEEFSMQLDVFYIPNIQLTFGKNMNPEDIEENDDVYFECKITANPAAYKVVWKHNDHLIQGNQKNRIIVSNEALVLQKVTHHQSGNYTCIASNVEGDGQSNVVHLKIMYKPICKIGQKRIYGIAHQEIAKIQCNVDSFPTPENFKWFLNNSAELIEVPDLNYHQMNSTSFLTYEPKSEFDYGILICLASNVVGQQLIPCVFHIVLAVKPEIPQNCSIFNQTSDSLGVECMTPNLNSDQKEQFILELYDQQNGSLLSNSSTDIPNFIITGLSPGKLLNIIIYAANSRGRSKSVILEAFTLKTAQKQTGLDGAIKNEFPILLATLIIVIVILLLIVGLILKSLDDHVKRKHGQTTCSQSLNNVLNDKITITLRSESEELLEKDERNPDVIPANKDSDYQINDHEIHLNETICDKEYDKTEKESNYDFDIKLDGKSIVKNLKGIQNESIYAELNISKPITRKLISEISPTLDRSVDNDRVIYAQIDPNKKGRLLLQPNHSSIQSTPSYFINNSLSSPYHYREIVTAKTPLIGPQQESCV